MSELSCITRHPPVVWELLGIVEGKVCVWGVGWQRGGRRGVESLHTSLGDKNFYLSWQQNPCQWLVYLSAPLYNKSAPHSCRYSVFHHLPSIPRSPLSNSKAFYSPHSTGPPVNITNDLCTAGSPKVSITPHLPRLDSSISLPFGKTFFTWTAKCHALPVSFRFLVSWPLCLCLLPNSECERAQAQFLAVFSADTFLQGTLSSLKALNSNLGFVGIQMVSLCSRSLPWALTPQIQLSIWTSNRPQTQLVIGSPKSTPTPSTAPQ